MAQYIFGGNTGETPQSIAQKRQLVNQIMGSSRAPSTFGQGLAAIGDGIAANVLGGRADRAEQAGQASANDTFSQIVASITGRGGSGPSSAASPQPSAGAVSPSIPSGDNAGYIRQGLINRGLPEHVADAFLMNMQDESGLNPGINEAAPIVPGSRGGYGLYQLTGPRRTAYEAYAQQQGVTPDNIDAQLDFLMTELQGPEARAYQAIMESPDTGSAAAAIVNNFLRPAEEHRARRAAAYTGGGSTQVAQGPDLAMLMKAASNPFIMDNPGMAAVINAQLSQAMQQQDPRYQQQMRQADLDYQMDEARLEAMNGPNWQNIQTGDGDYYRYDANDPNSTPSLWFDAPAMPAGPGNLGTTVYTGRDASGNVIPMQVGPNGSFVPTALPDGVSFDPGAMNAERAAGNVVGKGAGQAALDLPGAATEVQRITTQIADLKAHPGLDEVFGNLFGWSPIPNQWAPTLPNTDKASALARIDQMSGNAFLNGRALLKGQGQITDFESRKAEAAFARLSTAQTKEEFMGALDEFQQALEAGYAKIDAHAQGTQFSAGGSPGGSASPAMGNDPLGLF